MEVGNLTWEMINEDFGGTLGQEWPSPTLFLALHPDCPAHGCLQAAYR